MKLTKENKKYLLKMGYEKEDFRQIEEALTLSTYAIFKKGCIDKCRVISASTAKELLGTEEFLSALGRSTFHYSSSRFIPNTEEKFSISIDSGILFSDEKSRFLKMDSDDFEIELAE